MIHEEFNVARRYDAIVIGTGQSRPPRRPRKGLKTAAIERNLFGGTCVG
jgi:pyruvate/2-oxoglutarate dehydrogenase complex dihydrolipoamide dehydrogenase (E3) component